MIDVDLIKYLTREQAERMRGFEEMTATKGWKFLQEAFGAQFDAAQRAALAAQTWPENRIQIGRMQVLSELLNFEGAIANELESAAEAQRQQAQLEEVDAELEYE